MFKTSRLKIYFVHTVAPNGLEEGNEAKLKSGRRDTLCKMYELDDDKELFLSGWAILNKNDNMDKILGKKIALYNTICPKVEKGTPGAVEVKKDEWRVFLLDKQERKEIWDAFWVWVCNWGINLDELKPTGKAFNSVAELIEDLNKRDK